MKKFTQQEIDLKNQETIATLTETNAIIEKSGLSLEEIPSDGACQEIIDFFVSVLKSRQLT